MTFKGSSTLLENSQFDRVNLIFYYCCTVAMALSFIISHICPDIGRKSRNLYTPPVISAPVGGDTVGILQSCLVLR